VLLFDFPNSPYACTDDDTVTEKVFFGEIKSTVVDSLAGCGDRKLCEAVHPLCLALLNMLGWVEVSYFAAELDWKGSNVK
jgi:hypothetical protein